MSSAAPELTGSRLGPHRIEKVLGSGGMGKVYAAVLESDALGLAAGTRVALKVVHPHLLETPGFLERFLREGKLGVAIRHENVVRTYGSFSFGVEGRRTDFLVLELVEGQTLRGLQEQLRLVPEELCRHVAHEVAMGLAAIHEAGIVHRDLKPENVLITSDNVVKIMDLGVARSTDGDSRLTQTGAFVGSLMYAAPEQLSGKAAALDGRTDLYSLGVLLYELSAGANPYRSTDWQAVAHRVMNEAPRRLGSVNPQVSPFFEELVHSLLAKNPEQRIGRARELAVLLELGEDSPWWLERARSMRAATNRLLRRIRIPRETALIGRDAEMTALRASFEKAKAGDGQVVLVDGEAGIGKSRLIDELVALLQREGEDLDFLYGSYPPGGAATASGAFATAYREHFGTDDLATTLSRYLEGVPLLVPGFAALLTNQAPPEGAHALTKDSAQTCFVHATRGIAAERIAIILIDDLHFAPEDGKALFASLALAVPGHRILLVGTSRPPLDEKWTADIVRMGHASRVSVGRLGARHLVALLEDALRSSHLAEELSSRIATKTDGNPFFVFEVLRALKDGQYLKQGTDGRWTTTKVIQEIQIPSSISDMIQARVGDLSEEERSLLEIAACIGFEFDAGQVGDVAGLSRIPLLRAFGTIERRHRLIRGVGRRYVFDHHQVQEQLYGRLSEFLREGYHAAIAESLERTSGAASKDISMLDGALSADLCEHFLMGARGDAALRYLPLACEHLVKGYGNARAAALVERALALPDLLAGPERADALVRLCGPLSLLGRHARNEESAREAVQLSEATGDGSLRARAAQALGLALLRVTRLAEAETAFQGAVDLACACGEKGIEANACMNLGTSCFHQGRLDEARAHWERSRELGREIGDRATEAGSIVNLGNVLSEQWRMAEAREYYERGMAACRASGQRRFEAVAAGQLANLCKKLSLYAEARQHYARALALFRETGDRNGEATTLSGLGNLSLEEQDYVAAREFCLAGHVLGEEIGHRLMVLVSELNMAEMSHQSGEEAEAWEWAVKALDKALALGRKGMETIALCQLASRSSEDLKAAETSLGANEALLDVDEHLGGRWILWKASGDETHLAMAKRLLDEYMAGVPEELRSGMLTNVRLHRDIVAAWEEMERARGSGTPG